MASHGEDDPYRRFDQFAAATLYEAAGKAGDMSPGIRPLERGMRVVGRAFTVRCWQGDGSAFMRAVDLAAEGDVLVIDSGAGASSTCWGGTGTVAAMQRRLGGVVTNGSVRDVKEIVAAGFPVFCAGASVRGVTRSGSGEVGTPISVGGVVVAPGDLVVGDEDGVVVVSGDSMDKVYPAALERKAREEDYTRRILAGERYSVITGVAAEGVDG